MKPDAKTIEIKVERVIPAPAAEVFDAWLDAKTPGTVWNAAEEFSMAAKEGGLFYWALKGTAHYGRFTEINRPHRIQHTWVSPNTLGRESIVTVKFEDVGRATRMTLVHSALPETDEARGHERGWSYFVGVFLEQFGSGSRKKFSWEEAHSPTNK